ncbi:peptidoglycan DD-metalloendopeptidase family protein [Alteromonas oceanisediminis]|uniref:peptidoglycan DD-metalloendopeptidase family protein n=1 Tax=Alteromonas oceanisediminis TaxID=2836180 RepID=UPI001BD9D6A3|nr:peptidoglycan DD-metalloendopeptidase family protein [Alteromonas oceanisediminis]MBT0585391.1 peptidoglycan DD-metalloendopeptidase family protein [Alteromonas oceanisediminis]
MGRVFGLGGCFTGCCCLLLLTLTGQKTVVVTGADLRCTIPFRYLARLLLALYSSALLLGCSTQHTPAPVTTLDMRVEEPAGPFSGSTYTVQPGDTLFAIAWYSGNDYRDLAKYNNLSAPYTIKVGQSLRLTAPVASRGRTSSPVAPKPVDRKPEQAYGESEQNVKTVPRRVELPKRNTPAPPRSSAPPTQFASKVNTWVWPAEGELVGLFDASESGNKGIDIRNQRGTPVVAAADGKVVYTGEALRGYGRLIIVKHTDTFLSAYAHNDTIEVKEQQWVSAGQKIGTMGNSGTDSVMLHFEVRYRGKSLDPIRYLPRR